MFLLHLKQLKHLNHNRKRKSPATYKQGILISLYSFFMYTDRLIFFQLR